MDITLTVPPRLEGILNLLLAKIQRDDPRATATSVVTRWALQPLEVAAADLMRDEAAALSIRIARLAAQDKAEVEALVASKE